MYIYLVINTSNNKRSLIASHFPDLERGAVIRHLEHNVRVVSRAMSPERALSDDQLAFLPFLN